MHSIKKVERKVRWQQSSPAAGQLTWDLGANVQKMYAVTAFFCQDHVLTRMDGWEAHRISAHVHGPCMGKRNLCCSVFAGPMRPGGAPAVTHIHGPAVCTPPYSTPYFWSVERSVKRKDVRRLKVKTLIV